MISRVLRFELSAILRFEMRRIRKTGEQPYFIKTVEYMNLVFGDSQQSRDYWNGELKNWLRKRFPNSLDGMPEDVDLKEVVMNFIPPTPSLFHETPTGLCTLFHKFAVLAAVKFTGNSIYSTFIPIFSIPYSSFSYSSPPLPSLPSPPLPFSFLSFLYFPSIPFPPVLFNPNSMPISSRL